jgi:carboxyl-terminal processing protease
MKNNRTVLYVILGVFAALFLCAGIASAGFVAYNTFANANLGELVGQSPIDLPAITDENATATPIPTQINTPVGAEVDLRALFRPMWETHTLLSDNFVEQPLDEDALAQGAINGLTLALEAHDVDLAALDVAETAASAQALSDAANTPDEYAGAFLPFWGAWRGVESNSLPPDVSYEYLMQESVRGMVDALGDPHTSYFDPDQLRQVNIDLEGTYEGIGAWVDPTADYLTIVAPIPGSPAEAAGLKPGDRIIAVDGDDMTGIDGDLVIRRVLGPAGTPVLLTIERDGEDAAFDVEIVRATIVIPTVEYEVLESNIAYLHLFNFGGDSAPEFHDALEALLAENPDGLIIDLRNNGGGFLHSTVDISSEFISDGVILYEEYGDGTRDTFEANGNGLALDGLPIVVLVNEGTASASEILAGALQDYQRAVLVGTTTFGKGSVQLQFNISGHDGAVRVTIARWLTPNERHIHGIGLEPDFLVELTDADIENELDPQLDFAVEYLLEQ